MKKWSAGWGEQEETPGPASVFALGRYWTDAPTSYRPGGNLNSNTLEIQNIKLRGLQVCVMVAPLSKLAKDSKSNGRFGLEIQPRTSGYQAEVRIFWSSINRTENKDSTGKARRDLNMVIHKCPQEPRIANSFTLLHLHFGWSQKGPIFLLFLPFCVCLKVPPAVHSSIPTLLDTKMISRKTVKSNNESTAITSCQYPNRKCLCKKNVVGGGGRGSN